MKLLLFLFFNLLIFCASAQNTIEAEKLFNSKDYVGAAGIYSTLLEKKPADMLLNYRMARCLYEMKDFQQAIIHFEKSGTKYPLKDYYLGDCHYLLYKFEEAAGYFTLYAEGLNVNKNLQKEAIDKAKRCEVGIRLMNRVENVEIIDSINVPKKDFLKFYKLSRETGKLSSQNLNMAGKGWLETASFITQRGDRKYYTDTVAGQLDLLKSDKLLDGWSTGNPLDGNINTNRDENYPFLMLDGVSLFFASNSLNSVGGYDIFFTRYNTEKGEYLTPENIGMPFNSIFNDYMMVIDESNSTGWFVTDRFQPKDRLVIYHFNYYEEKKYIRLENDTLQREFAMMKISKRVRKEKVIQPELPEIIPVVQTVGKLLFIVNDSVSYSKTEEFRSQQALNLWYEKYRADNEFREVEMKLNKLRIQFENEEDVLLKKNLIAEILDLEQKYLRFKVLLKEKDLSVRNEEINFLKNQN
jgi:hypothetical protein